MKTRRLNRQKRNTFIGIMLSILFLSMGSCAVVNSNFLDSAVVPAAEGKVKVTRDKNLNYNIEVSVTDLAEVEELQTSKHNYVVWMLTDEGRTENLGQLSSSPNGKASMETSSSYKPAKVFITAEDNTEAQVPGEQIVLTTASF